MLALSQPPRRVWNWVAENWLHSVHGKMLCGDLGREKCLCDGLVFLLQSEKNFLKNQWRNHLCCFFRSFLQPGSVGWDWLCGMHCVRQWRLRGVPVWVLLWRGSQSREGHWEPLSSGRRKSTAGVHPCPVSGILEHSLASTRSLPEAEMESQVGWTKRPRILALLDLSLNLSETQSSQLWNGN